MNDSLALKKHYEWKGKIETKVKVPVDNEADLALAYTPGVADACLAISKDKELSYKLTGRANNVAVITDGTAILGLGNIGPEAGMPVMEGKCALFKEYGGIDAFPICLDTTDTEEIIKTIKIISKSFGGINLEDISAPRCFDIEQRLIEELDIPVFHDDQHGTAIVTGAALINALKLVDKRIDEIKVVINGAGAAGTAIGKYLLTLGVKDLLMCDIDGIIVKGNKYSNKNHEELASITNHNLIKGNLADALTNADVFIGVSVGNIVSKEMVSKMENDAIVFSLANPIPEISKEEALKGNVKIYGSGSSKYPNQINNVLVFPGLFKGALKVRAKRITKSMMIAASYAIADAIGDKLSIDYILPKAIDKNAHEAVAKAVMEQAIKDGIAKVY